MPREPDSSPTDEHLIDASGESLAILERVLAGGIVMGAAAHYRASWAGALALSAVMAIPWFIATVVVNAAMFSPYAPY